MGGVVVQTHGRPAGPSKRDRLEHRIYEALRQRLRLRIFRGAIPHVKLAVFDKPSRRHHAVDTGLTCADLVNLLQVL